jgi:hypothetical protein
VDVTWISKLSWAAKKVDDNVSVCFDWMLVCAPASKITRTGFAGISGNDLFPSASVYLRGGITYSLNTAVGIVPVTVRFRVYVAIGGVHGRA